ncbi:MAG: RNA-binding transcriptional accessory protein [Planctomycetes bacterium]|nr:RNA-binding transcriptional accessory protein [Planctomycetota bacterium]MCB9891731.1 RNA-binding transcriptional accessory protein [Planctomycetota bacterium]
MAHAVFDPTSLLAEELSLPAPRIATVLQMMGEGATVPFLARYRKEATGGMDEVQIRAIQERCTYWTELHDRRETILASIDEQGKLTPELRARIEATKSKAELEDLYLPYKPKRRTRAMIAREKGLEPLAERILSQATDGDPEAEAQAFVDAEKGVENAEAALQGACDIVAELVGEDAACRAFVRGTLEKEGVLVSTKAKDVGDEPTKFEQYYDYRESLATIPSHRFLAIRRGENEDVLRVTIELDENLVLGMLEQTFSLAPNSPWGSLLRTAVADATKRLLLPSVTTDVRVDLKMKSDRAAVDVFAENLEHVLLAAPVGEKTIIGIDPGFRTGCKCVVVDQTGRFIENDTIYLVGSEDAKRAAAHKLLTLCRKYEPFALAVGNGTAGRETEAFCRKLVRDAEELAGTHVVSVNESGASVYSASEIAREEFPDLDLTIRGAISIARRLQDPLAELVKVDPKSIGVGQYQHDVQQTLLHRKLNEVVESCVNRVGVELNTASAPLLSRVAGIGPSLAKKIVKHREDNGLFGSRHDLKKVTGLGPRAYEQCAGFLRVQASPNPLDHSAVHPERYELVLRMALDMDVPLDQLVGNGTIADRIEIRQYVGDDVGEPTLRDIVAELKKPGRDPRSTFEPPRFQDDVLEIDDVKEGMELEGIVTNVTHFGAFVDIGVHQDGLVHISELADHFVEDPKDVVHAGQKLRVRVLEVDLARKRIALSARSEPGPRVRRGEGGQRPARGDVLQPRGRQMERGGRGHQTPQPPQPPNEGQNNPFKQFRSN